MNYAGAEESDPFNRIVEAYKTSQRDLLMKSHSQDISTLRTLLNTEKVRISRNMPQLVAQEVALSY